MSTSLAPSKTGVARWTPSRTVCAKRSRPSSSSSSSISTWCSSVKIFFSFARSASPVHCVLDHLVDLLAEVERRPTEVRLEDLPDVHARRHAQRVEHDVDRRPVGEVRHVLLRQDARDDALVAVATGHLVADRQLALDGHVDLDHLDDARRELVALGELGDLVAVERLDGVARPRPGARPAAPASRSVLPASSTCSSRPVARRDLVERGALDLLRPWRRGPCPCRRPGAPPWSCRPAACASWRSTTRRRSSSRRAGRRAASPSRRPRCPWRARPSRCPCARTPWR